VEDSLLSVLSILHSNQDHLRPLLQELMQTLLSLLPQQEIPIPSPQALLEHWLQAGEAQVFHHQLLQEFSWVHMQVAHTSKSLPHLSVSSPQMYSKAQTSTTKTVASRHISTL
jgi:hypothetical protein